MILMLTDTDGDDVAIYDAAICAVTVGRMAKPLEQHTGGAADHDPHVVTLVHTLAGPLVVAQSLEAVVTAWQTALAKRVR
jgi:hypothetical protein